MQTFEKCLKQYQAGDYRAVTATLQPLADKGRLSDLALVAVLAQSFYRLGDVESAARYYAMAGSRGGPQQLQFLQIAFGIFKTRAMIEEGMRLARDLLSLNPAHREAAMFYRHNLHYILAMDELRDYNASALQRLENGDAFERSIDQLLNHVCWCADEALNQSITAMQSGAPFDPERRRLRRARVPAHRDRIRIGYLSNDLSDLHPTTLLFRGVLDHHDREKFEIFVFCYTSDAYRNADKAFRAGCQNLVDILHLTDEQSADLINGYDLDILVDLKGHTDQARIELVNMGMAPVQVAYLGFPGSGNGIDCDYVVSDATVTPDSSRPFYHEKLCRLPDSYQPNDCVHRPLPAPASRRALGLPQDKIVFAAFNHIRKISPETFDSWVAVLKAVENSVLWFLCENVVAKRNFLAAMARAGIDGSRIVFAGHTDQVAHLARLPAADIGLDTFPYNGHTTTSDQLWAGLPVVTKKGSHFASRVSESLLKALGVEELIAEDRDGYVRLCAALAADPAALSALREKLVRNRFIASLFDTERYTRHLEIAYAQMVDRAQRGLEPDHMDIAALPPRAASFAPPVMTR